MMSCIRRTCLTLLSLNLLVATCVAEQTIYEVDLTGKLPQKDEVIYYVNFVARNTPTDKGKKKFPGHAYVVWEKVDPKSKQSTTDQFEAWGFYPPELSEDFSKLDFKGALRAEFNGNEADIFKLRARVSKQAFDQSKSSIPSWDQKDISYDAFALSCVDFTAEVANAVGLEVPEATGTNNLPRNFLQSLMKANGWDE